MGQDIGANACCNALCMQADRHPLGVIYATGWCASHDHLFSSRTLTLGAKVEMSLRSLKCIAV